MYVGAAMDGNHVGETDGTYLGAVDGLGVGTDGQLFVQPELLNDEQVDEELHQ